MPSQFGGVALEETGGSKYGGVPIDQPSNEDNWQDKFRKAAVPVNKGGIIGMMAGGPLGAAIGNFFGPKQGEISVGGEAVRPTLTAVGSGLGAVGGPVGSFAGGFSGSQAGRLLQEFSPRLFGEADDPLTGGLKDAVINEVFNGAFKGLKKTPELVNAIKERFFPTEAPPLEMAPEMTPGNIVPGKITSAPGQTILREHGETLRKDIGNNAPHSYEAQGKQAYERIAPLLDELEANKPVTKNAKGQTVEDNYDPLDELPPDIRRGVKAARPVEQGGEGTPSKFFDAAIKTPEGTRRLVDYVGREDVANHLLTRFLEEHNTYNQSTGIRYFNSVKAVDKWNSPTYQAIMREATNADQRGQITYFLKHAVSIDPRLSEGMVLSPNNTGNGSFKLNIPDVMVSRVLPKLAAKFGASLGGAFLGGHVGGPIGAAAGMHIGLEIANSDFAKRLLEPRVARAAASALKIPLKAAPAQDAMQILLNAFAGTQVKVIRDGEEVGETTLR